MTPYPQYIFGTRRTLEEVTQYAPRIQRLLPAPFGGAIYFWHIRELCLVGGLPSGKEALPPRHTANFFHADGTSRVVTLVFSSHVESATT